MDSLLELFFDVFDFCQAFVPIWRDQLLSAGEIQRQRERSLSMSDVMSILIHFHQSHYQDFKAYYADYVLERLRGEFPGLVSLHTLCRVHPIGSGSTVCLSVNILFGNLQRDFVHPFYCSGCK